MSKHIQKINIVPHLTDVLFTHPFNTLNASVAVIEKTGF